MSDNNAPNLLDAVSEATEYKNPGSTDKSFEWKFDEDGNGKETEVEDPPGEETGQSEKEKTGDKKKPLTHAVKDESAEAATGMLDLLQTAICTPLVSYKYKEKFSDAEIDRLDTSNIIDAKLESLKDDDLTLRNKWDRLMTKCERKLEKIPLKANARANVKNAFYKYFEVKQTSMPIEWYIGFTIADSLISRVIDVMTD